MASTSPQKRPRPDDMPEFDVEAARRRMLDAVLNGAPPYFIAALAGAGLTASPARTIRQVFDAYERASVMEADAPGFRSKALAEVQAEAGLIEQVLAGVEALRAMREAAEIGPRRIDEFAERRGRLRLNLDRRDLSDLSLSFRAEKERSEDRLAALDGRSRPPSRLRRFADELAPLFFAARPKEKGSAPAFGSFLAASVELMTGARPKGSLVWTVPRHIAAGQ